MSGNKKSQPKQAVNTPTPKSPYPINQTIRVQIDLPFHQAYYNNPHTPNSICLQINFDNKNKNIPIQISTENSNTKCVQNNQAKLTQHNDDSMCSLTSGYSTSSLISSCSSTASCDSNKSQNTSNRENLLVVNTPLNYESSDLSNIYMNKSEHSNLYDKLTYPNSVSNKARLIKKVTSDDTNSTIYSNGIAFNAENEHFYEDITNCVGYSRKLFKQSSMESNYEQLDNFSSAYVTRSSQIKRLNVTSMLTVPNADITSSFVPRKCIYKREYTVNEIFQNVKKFKEDAIEQELVNTEPTYVNSKFNTDFLKLQADAKSRGSTSEQIKSSVSIIKQIFEIKSQSAVEEKTDSRKRARKLISLNTSQSKELSKAARQATVSTRATRRHVYVNEKLPQPINV